MTSTKKVTRLTRTDKAWIDGYFEGLRSAQNVQPLHKIDAESKKFIEWTRKHLSDPDYFLLLSCLIERQLSNFLNGDKEKLLTALTEKMEKGVLEHGKPSHSQAEVHEELQQEFLDLIGWNMVRLWNLRKRGTHDR